MAKIISLNIPFFQKTVQPPFLEIAARCVNFIQNAKINYFYPRDPVDTSEWPEYRKLRVMEKQPSYGSVKPPRMPKMLRILRGPEPVHTDFLYKGYGVKALLGGRLRHENFEFIRNRVNKKLDTKRMFALWRVEAPWQPVAKKGIGKRMGGGKGPIHHYVTPVKADRVIIELGGDLHEEEARAILSPIASVLPFPARVYSQAEIDAERENFKWINENNKNPYTMEYVIRNNIGGCKAWLSKYDYQWFGWYK